MADIPHGINPKPARPKRSRVVPPSIGSLKTQGVKGVRAFCSSFKCGHHAVIAFEVIGKPDETLFPSIRFKCSKCGNRDVQTQPDWPHPSDRIPSTWGRRL